MPLLYLNAQEILFPTLLLFRIQTKRIHFLPSVDIAGGSRMNLPSSQTEIVRACDIHFAALFSKPTQGNRNV